MRAVVEVPLGLPDGDDRQLGADDGEERLEGGRGPLERGARGDAGRQGPVGALDQDDLDGLAAHSGILTRVTRAAPWRVSERTLSWPYHSLMVLTTRSWASG